MSLQVEHLTKQYGQQLAVNDISFEVETGEIVGFLGPNGAGKSTTMKIATSFVPPTSGVVRVSGFDVVSQAMDVKRVTGYLPEHNPLYLDMYVHEYLGFTGGLHGLSGKRLKDRVAEMVELCGLVKEQNKKIETLSKGYRQRVGLAQALIHNPNVLILDEPTSGLDPNQLIEIRKLIKQISEQKTVLFSTHIMQEVSALCDRVIVINQGKIVANDKLSNLITKRSELISVIVEFEGLIDQSKLKEISNVIEVVHLEGGKYRLTSQHQDSLRQDVFRFAADNNLSLIGLKQEENTLEGIFKELTTTPVDQQ